MSWRELNHGEFSWHINWYKVLVGFFVGVVLGLIVINLSGCGRFTRETLTYSKKGGAALATDLGEMMLNFGKGLGAAESFEGGLLPLSGMGSMASDQLAHGGSEVITMDKVREIAGQYGYTIE